MESRTLIHLLQTAFQQAYEEDLSKEELEQRVFQEVYEELGMIDSSSGMYV